MFNVDDLEAEARHKAGTTETGWSLYRSLAVAYYPVSKRYNYFIDKDVVNKGEFKAYLTRGYRRADTVRVKRGPDDLYNKTSEE